MAPTGLFVTDLDGTLLTWGGVVPRENLEAMRRATEAGVVVAIATGRRRSTVRREYAKLDGVRHRVACSNGAVLLAEDNDTPEVVLTLPWEPVRDLAARPELAHARVHCITLPDHAADGAEAVETFVVTAHDRRWAAAPRPWDEASYAEVDAASALGRRLVHVALHLPTREESEAAEGIVRELFGPGAAVHSVRSPGAAGALLEACVSGGKGNAIRLLCERLGVEPSRTGALGDDMNDAALLDAARHPFAVGGSVLAQRHPAAAEVGPAEEGAVARALDRFLADLGLA